MSYVVGYPRTVQDNPILVLHLDSLYHTAHPPHNYSVPGIRDDGNLIGNDGEPNPWLVKKG